MPMLASLNLPVQLKSHKTSLPVVCNIKLPYHKYLHLQSSCLHITHKAIAHHRSSAPIWIGILVKQRNLVYEKWCMKRLFDEDR